MSRTVRAPTMFAAFLVSVLAGCGGGGKGGSSPGGTRIAGVVAVGDAAVSGAQVELVDAAGATLGRATSAQDGSFEVTWSGAVPAAGLRLVATGGTAGAAALSGSLRAVVLPEDDLAHAHVTPLTALVVRLGEALGGATPAGGRAAAEQRLVALGVLAAGEWRSLAPSSVGLADLRLEALARGATPLVDEVAAELAAGELSPAWMRCFPGAHGGIAAVTVAGASGALTVPAGSTAAFQVTAQQVGATPSAGYTYHLVGAPAWASIDAAGVLAVSPPAEAAGTRPELTVRVEVAATGLGRAVTAAISAPAAEVAAAGAVGPEGGTVLDASGELAVDVPPGSVSGPTVVQVRRWLNDQGLPAYEVTADAPLDGVRLLVPEPGGSTATTVPAASAGATAVHALRAGSRPRALAASAPGIDPWAAVSVVRWQQTTALFDVPSGSAVLLGLSTGQRLPGADPGGPVPYTVTRLVASELYIVGPTSGMPLPGQTPVLFIHGYQGTGGLGGGPGTWGNFLPLLHQAPGGYIPFEFRWNTSARFEDAAADLRKAVDLIAARTGKHVHLVAHSFGGLLARTYLQGLATRPASESWYACPVASLTTLGTPHSGVGATGRDATTIGDRIGLCPDLTCWEAGGGELLTVTTLPIASRFGLELAPGSITRALADLAAHPLPPIPVQVLVGLTVDAATGRLQSGDGLISFAGQRFLPAGTDPQTIGSVALTETVLGAALWDATGSAGPYVPRVQLHSVRNLYQLGRFELAPDYPLGYRHADMSFLGIDLNGRSGLFEASVPCTADAGCGHEAYERVKAFLNAHGAARFTGDGAPPTVPGGVTATATGPGTIQVSWSPSTDDVGVTGYDVERAGGSTVRVSAPTWADTGLRPATWYCYRVTAVDTSGKPSGVSATACATTAGVADTTPPTTPTGLHTVSVGTSRVDLAWTASTDAAGVALYRLYRDGTSIQATAGTTGFDSGVGAGQRHCYHVVALDAAGNASPASADACVSTLTAPDVTPPTVPAGLTVQPTGADRLTLRWSASSDASGVTSYRVHRNGSLLGEVTGTSLVSASLSPATRYCYTVTALDAARNASLPSALVCATTPAGADTTPPSIPGGLSATVTGPNRISLTWTASADDVAVAGYRVVRGGQLLRSTTATALDDTSVVTGTTYCYAVSAFDAALNESSTGPAVCVTPVAAAVSPTVSVSPPSGAKGIHFSEPGTGFTPGGMVVLHFRKPSGVELTATTNADAQGRYAWIYDSSTADERGTFTYWAVDVATGTRSPAATFRITADALLGAYPWSSAELTLEGDSVLYVASIANQTGAALAGIYLQAWIEQGQARRGASGGTISCGAGDGVLPPAGCQEMTTVMATNAADGSGTLVPGAATAAIELRRYLSGVDELLDTARFPVTLVSAGAAPALSGSGGGTWAYRRPISVVSSAPAQGAYVVPVVLDTTPLVYGGKLRPDGGDLRFATAGGAELPWWPEGGVSSTAAPTTAWVRLDALPAGTSTVYAYYGNPSAVRGGAYAWNGKSTFDVFDEFEASWLDPAVWSSTSVRYPFASVTGGAARLDASWPNNSANDGRFMRPLRAFSAGMVAEFSMTRNAQPLDPTWKSTLFSVHVEPAAAVALETRYARVASGWWSNGVYDCGAINGTYLAQARVNVDEGTLAMTLGGVPCGQVALGLPAGGSYGLTLVDEAGYGSDAVALWDFRMRPFVDPEPTTSTSGTEQALAR